jgi:hypothetical protein
MENITLEILRKIQDKKYEIDIQYEQTRDLYEKQRVVDQFLEEHQEDKEILHGYYENNYSKSKMNKFLKFIYNNSYDLSAVRLNLFASTFATGLATGCLGMIHPYLALLTIYDWYLLAAFSSQVVNRTVHMMTLHNNKYHIILNKTNFLGFETEKQVIVMIRDIKYTGEYKNNYLSFDYTGLLPSISKLMTMSADAGHSKDILVKGHSLASSISDKDKDTYKHFVSFMVED